jgi:hypothetical protein
MRRWTVAAASALVLAAIVTSAGCGGSNGGRPRTDTRALWRLQLRIEHDAGYLARRGVFFKYAGQGANRQGACVYVGLANPTAPNVAFVRRRFGGPLCIGHVGGPFNGCAEVSTRPGPQRRRVPDLLGLGVVAAQDRAGRRVPGRAVVFERGERPPASVAVDPGVPGPRDGAVPQARDTGVTSHPDHPPGHRRPARRLHLHLVGVRRPAALRRHSTAMTHVVARTA